MSQWEASIGKFSWMVVEEATKNHLLGSFFLVENLWLLDQCEVVGGSDKGGILVRKGQDLKSEQCADRLGSKVCYPNKTTKKEGLIRLMEEIRLTS